MIFLLHISDSIKPLKRELEQLHGKLKKKPGLDRTLTLGHAIALHSAPPLSYQAIRELLIFELVLHLPGEIWIVIYLTFHIYSVLFTSLMGNSKQARNRPPCAGKALSLSGSAEFSCTVLSSSSVQDCFFFSFLCNCFSCFLDCHDHSNIILQPFLSGRIFKSYYQKLSLLKGVIHRLSLGIVCIEQLCTHFFFISKWVLYIFIALKIIQILIRCEILDSYWRYTVLNSLLISQGWSLQKQELFSMTVNRVYHSGGIRFQIMSYEDEFVQQIQTIPTWIASDADSWREK